MSERLAPHDLDSEAAVLSAMLLDPAAVDVSMDLLEPEHFYSEANRRICEAIAELARKGDPVDLVTTTGALRDRGRLAQVGGSAYLAQLVDTVPAVAHIEAYAHRVRDAARLRSLINACTKIAADAYGPIESAQSFIDAAGQSVFEVASSTEQKEISTLEQALRKGINRMREAEARGGAVELSTGLTLLDRKIGGLGRGRVTILAARPGMGKTSMATGIAENVAGDGGPVAIFSMEQPDSELAIRMACSRAGVSVQQGLNGWLPDQPRAMMLFASDELKGLPIWIDDTPALTLLRMRARARSVAIKAGKRLSLIVVDYLQLMSSPRTDVRKTRERELSEMTAGFKQMAKELDCAVLLLSQLNREVEQEKDKRPRLHHLRESGGIEQDADDVIFIYRDDYYHDDSEEKGIAELIVAKQRNGPTGFVKVRFYGSSTSFDNL